jgi:hypothetical protein
VLNPFSIELCLGHGITALSETLILKLILTRSFELSRLAAFSRPMTAGEPS